MAIVMGMLEGEKGNYLRLISGLYWENEMNWWANSKGGTCYGEGSKTPVDSNRN
jgi:hypothetical protein